MRPLLIVVTALSLATGAAQTDTEWSYWAGVDFVVTRGAGNSAAPVVMADRGRVHLEARSNYEGDRSGSLWSGYNIRSASGRGWTLTPMVGVVFGETSGVAPGLEAICEWRTLDFYAEAEHLFSSSTAGEDFTYIWSELAVSPAEWLRTGVAAQWTATRGEPAHLQPGALLGFAWRKITLTGFLFEPGNEDESFVLTAGVEY